MRQWVESMAETVEQKRPCCLEEITSSEHTLWGVVVPALRTDSAYLSKEAPAGDDPSWAVRWWGTTTKTGSGKIARLCELSHTSHVDVWCMPLVKGLPKSPWLMVATWVPSAGIYSHFFHLTISRFFISSR